MNRERFFVLLVLALSALYAASGDCATIYVKWDSPYDGPGNDWEHAFHMVQAGINAASAGDEVWVAAGTYVERITLKADVALYGGFVGSEAALAERPAFPRPSPDPNETILDGGQGGSVVTASGLGYGTARIDGFTIRNGKSGYGGGIYCEFSSPTIANNTITGNSASNDGGGIYCYYFSPTIANNTISSNSVGFSGGGIYCYSSSPTIANNTMTSNSASSGGGIYCYFLSSPNIANNIVAFNSSGIYRSGGSPLLWNNCVYNPGGSNYSGISPGIGDIQVDPRLAAPEYGQVHIQPDSPCVDAGDDSAVGSGWADMDGQARIQGLHVDIGADESDGTVWVFTPRVVRVSPTGDDANDGSSWALAKRTVQSAIEAASTGGGEVWVAAGTYPERITLKNYVYLYGGFAGNESALAERPAFPRPSPDPNETTLDGGQGGSVVTASGLGYGTARLDGFTIRNGKSGNGGGIYCNSSSPTIANNTISSNNANYGGGIYCNSSSPTIANNTITGNTASYGGGIFCTSSSPSIANNTITGNSANYGGGIYCNSSSPSIANNTFTGNSAGYGGGIYCEFSSPTIANNTIGSNSAGFSGGGISCHGSSPTIANNIVAFNSSGIYRSGSSPLLRNNCVYNPLGSNYSGISPGIGDIQVDPIFADRLSGDYHLSADSPCIDAGWDNVVRSDWLDLDGEPRIIGGHVDIGADEYWASASIAEWKAAANGTSVRLRAEIVTAAFDGFFYVEAEDRSAGIRVEKAGHGLQVGDRADVDGVLFTNSDGEKCIMASMARARGAGSVKPLALGIRSLGGGDWRYDPAAGKGQSGVFGGLGLNNIGLLVRCWGKVYFVEGSIFILDDGSSYADPESNPPYPVPTRAKVLCPAGVTPPAVGQYVVVTGVSSCEMRPDGKLDRLLRIRRAEDIHVLQ